MEWNFFLRKKCFQNERFYSYQFTNAHQFVTCSRFVRKKIERLSSDEYNLMT